MSPVVRIRSVFSATSPCGSASIARTMEAQGRQAVAREDVLDRGECESLVRVCGSPSEFTCFIGRR
jgi:hypothetical protein